MEGLTATSTLAEIVRTAPGSERALEAHALDYCCGGRRRLVDACAETGVDPDAVLAEIDALGPAAPVAWATMRPGELVDHLESTHHAYLHAELPRLSALTAKVVGAHGERHPELAEVQRVFEAVRLDLEPHLAKEEQVLFPMIRELDRASAPPVFHCGSLRNPISVMLREHDAAGELLRRLRDVTGAFSTPGDGCASYRALYDGYARLEADTHLHIHKENDVLFPAVVALEAAVATAGA
ncbi:MAG TPA: iron-sulfur cluster repair di-iron protein [Acidimicrobiales bacterium]|nr:iron-sulfur cluster repair di-iron protein [Acidimicrobiales bacterium]